MRLIITRHGETEENALGIMQGHLPGTLSKEGIEQARKLALRLKDEHIDFIYSSDLARASDTANEIARYHKQVPLEFTTELRERHLGEFQGKKKSDFGWDPKELKTTYVDPKEGETKQQLFNRANAFIHRILSKHKSDTVLLVGHNGICKAIIAAITGKGHDDLEQIENLKNTSISILELDDDKNHKIHLFNCSKHL